MRAAGDNRPLRRLAYRGLSLTCVGLAAAGAVLPLLPTTPFLLVAAWAAGKSSPRLHAWLRTHPRFGPPLAAWQDERAVSGRAKATACAALLLSWTVLALTADRPLVPAVVGVLMLGIAGFILSRPRPRSGEAAEVAQ